MRKSNRTILIKACIAVLMTLLITAGISGPDGYVYAGGSARITLGSFSGNGLPDGTKFTFNIYKVGTWTHDEDGKAVLELDAAIAEGAGVSTTLPSDNEKLVGVSDTVGNYVKTASLTPAADAITLATGESASGTGTFNGLADNGLYVVVSDTVVVEPKEWTPRSVFVGILNGESEMTISNDVVTKMTSAPVVNTYTVRKVWEDDSNAKGYRPDSVKAGIYYNGELKDTVTLNDGNAWAFSWNYYENDDGQIIYESNAADNSNTVSETLNEENGWSANIGDKSENGTWTVTEIRGESLRKYTFELGTPSDDSPGLFTLTNTYSSTDLKITKRLDGFFDTGDKSNVTVAFKITGKDADGNVVYTNYAGIAFSRDDAVDADGKYIKDVTIRDIPLSATNMLIEEVYSSGYTPDEASKNAVKGDDDIWTVTFDNTHGDHSGSGVVNKYENGKIKEQQGI